MILRPLWALGAGVVRLNVQKCTTPMLTHSGNAHSMLWPAIFQTKKNATTLVEDLFCIFQVNSADRALLSAFKEITQMAGRFNLSAVSVWAFDS